MGPSGLASDGARAELPFRARPKPNPSIPSCHGLRNRQPDLQKNKYWILSIVQLNFLYKYTIQFSSNGYIDVELLRMPIRVPDYISY